MALIIGASLSEPHINGTAMRAIYGICIYVYMYICIYVYMYVYMYGTTVTFRIYGYSNLANCKFTLMRYTAMSECQAVKEPRLQQENSASATARKIEDS